MSPPASPSPLHSSTSLERRRRLLMTGLAAIALAGLVLAVKIIGNAPEVSQGGPPAGEMRPAAVYVISPQQRSTREVATVTGTLRASARSEVAAREAGAITSVLVDEGDTVSKDAILARLDHRRAQAQLEETKAKLTAAQSLVSQREAEWKRAQEDLVMKQGLLDRKAISRSDLLDAQQGLAVASAQRDAAKEGVEEAINRVAFLEIQLEDTVIVAPFDGVVVERHVELGEWVSPGSLLVTLVQIDPVEAWLRVPTRYQTGMQMSPNDLRIRFSASGRTLTPDALTLVPDVEPTSQLLTVVASLENPDREHTPGESITGLVPVAAEASYWHFPTDAVVRTPMGAFVYRASPENTAERVAVEVAFERDGEAFVLVASSSTLGAEDQLIVEGNERLIPGQPLMIQVRRGAPSPTQP